MLAKAYNKMTETVQLCLVLPVIEWESAVLVGGFFMERTEKSKWDETFYLYGNNVCFLVFFTLIFNYIYVSVRCARISRTGCFFCSGLFFNGIRSGCCPDVNCIRAWGLEENMYHKQTRWIRGGKWRSTARYVEGRGTPGDFHCYGDTSCCSYSLFGVHRPFIYTAYDIAIVHSACSCKREKQQHRTRGRYITQLSSLVPTTRPGRVSLFTLVTAYPSL